MSEAVLLVIRLICGISMKDRTNRELRKRVGVDPITTEVVG